MNGYANMPAALQDEGTDFLENLLNTGKEQITSLVKKGGDAAGQYVQQQINPGSAPQQTTQPILAPTSTPAPPYTLAPVEQPAAPNKAVAIAMHPATLGVATTAAAKFLLKWGWIPSILTGAGVAGGKMYYDKKKAESTI